MNHTSFAIAVFSCGLPLGCSAQDEPAPTSLPAQQDPVARTAETPARHAAFDAILRANVRDQQVDYLAVRDRHFEALRGYLDQLAEIDPAKLTRDQRLAHYINLYNATMIAVVCERLHAGYTTAANDWGVFKEPLVRTQAKKISFNDLENEIIRPQFGEPRIHVALVCGARSCPPILDRAYTTSDLETLLEANMRRFLRDPSRNKIEEDRVWLSPIFDWYKIDFGGDDGLPEYVGRYIDRDLAGAKIEFLDYSWDLNIAAPKGRWIRMKRAAEQVELDQILEVLEEEGERLRLRQPFGRGEVWVAADATTPYRVGS